MPSRPQLSQTGFDPLAPVGALVHWLAVATAEVALGVLVGRLGARLMRRLNLHWGWALVGLALVLTMHRALGSASPMLAVAMLAAATRVRRWHRDDVQAGCDLAASADRRVTPLSAFGRALGRSFHAFGRTRRIRPGASLGGSRGELVLGHEAGGRALEIPLSLSGGGRHMLIIGATGSGKTVTQTWIASQAIARGMGAVVIDPKGDRFMRATLRRAAETAGRRYIEWTPSGTSVYNPYAHGSDTEIADKVLAGERFSEPHYLRQAQRYLGHVVRTLRGAGVEVSLAAIVAHLDRDELEVRARQLDEREALVTHAYLDSLTSRQMRDLAGVRDRLAILTESDVGRWLDPRTAAVPRFDLLEAVRDRAVVYFDLAADSRPLLAQMLGAAVVQDLQTTVAALQGRPVPTVAVIDEFSALAAPQVVRLFGRARSSGLSLLLGTQELTDLRVAGRERLLEQVIGNLSVLVAHRQVVPASAELVARISGVRGAWKTMRRADGTFTRTRVREQVLRPEQVMELARGWAAVSVLEAGSPARIVSVMTPPAGPPASDVISDSLAGTSAPACGGGRR
ncbi:MAG: DUF853 family protein [Actinobacteria bacterium]|nr:MAG: DUF853 family protein [Actinomycetota bacterium]